MGLCWVGLGWFRLLWVALGWLGLAWVGLGWVWVGFWLGLGWVWLVWGAFAFKVLCKVLVRLQGFSIKLSFECFVVLLPGFERLAFCFILNARVYCYTMIRLLWKVGFQ